jgi:hypothetical protein
VLAGSVQLHQVCFLARRELGLFAAEAALGLGDLMLTRARVNQVSFELGDHRQDVEQQPPHRVGRIVHRAAEVELDLSTGEVSTMSRASGSERARRSSLVTTSVSPARHAASASRRPGRSR